MNGIDRVIAEARDTVADAKCGCGRFNEEIDCKAYLSRDLTCPGCSYETVRDLDDALQALDEQDEDGGDER